MPAPLAAPAEPTARPLGPTERRAERRYRCRWPRLVRLAAPPLAGTARAVLWDVSAGGVALLGEQPFEVGTVLTVPLGDRPAGRTRVLTARVRHVAALEEGFWLVGCSLSRPLAEEDLLALL